MFYNKINLFFFNKIITKRLTNVTSYNSIGSIKKVGVILDEKLSDSKDKIKDILNKNSILDSNITFITFKRKLIKGELEQFDVFTSKDVGFSGVFNSARLNWFLDDTFDLIINFYQEPNPFLMLLTQLSHSNMKVGFASVDNRLNHLVIKTKSNDTSIFLDEMIKYLRTLNKL
jgi:hypothetical protein